MDDNIMIGFAIKKIRTDKHLSQQFVAHNIMSVRNLRNIENGVSMISTDNFFMVLDRIAPILVFGT
ncbi:MAG: helix-turn-helix domain-containing protein [Lactobacillaceae bacterium]|nr:helix-turn-helix domain-containing protein [Lactobacillaceae bacterium]